MGDRESWLPIDGDDLQDLSGLSNPQGREGDGQATEAVRPAEQGAFTLWLEAQDRQRQTQPGHPTAPKPLWIGEPLDIQDLAGSAGQALAQPNSGLVKLSVGVLSAQDFKTCRHAVR